MNKKNKELTLEEIKEILFKEKIISQRTRNNKPHFIIHPHFRLLWRVNDWPELEIPILEKHPELESYIKSFPGIHSFVWSIIHDKLEAPKCPYCDSASEFVNDGCGGKFLKTCNNIDCILKGWQEEISKNRGGVLEETEYLREIKKILFEENIIYFRPAHKRINLNVHVYRRFGTHSWKVITDNLSYKYPILESFFKEFRSADEVTHALTYNLREAPKCPHCGNPKKFLKILNKDLGYNQDDPFSRYHRTCCNKKCSNLELSQTWKETPEEDKELRSKKTVETNLRRHGYAWPSQNSEVMRKRQRKYLYQNLHFDSSWELYLYIYCLDHNIPIEKNPEPIDYFDESGKLHKYYPDFKINGKLIEIKGGHLIDSEGNLIPGPWLAKLSEEDYKKEEARLRAKQKCMEENNVELLLHEDLEKYSKYVQQTYGRSYIEQFRIESKKKGAAD